MPRKGVLIGGLFLLGLALIVFDSARAEVKNPEEPVTTGTVTRPAPTRQPTQPPTKEPTQPPTQPPTQVPTAKPTEPPTQTPPPATQTAVPTQPREPREFQFPTRAPTGTPARTPTVVATPRGTPAAAAPTVPPVPTPTRAQAPTGTPSRQPTTPAQPQVLADQVRPGTTITLGPITVTNNSGQPANVRLVGDQLTIAVPDGFEVRAEGTQGCVRDGGRQNVIRCRVQPGAHVIITVLGVSRQPASTPQPPAQVVRPTGPAPRAPRTGAFGQFDTTVGFVVPAVVILMLLTGPLLVISRRR